MNSFSTDHYTDSQTELERWPRSFWLHLDFVHSKCWVHIVSTVCGWIISTRFRVASSIWTRRRRARSTSCYFLEERVHIVQWRFARVQPLTPRSRIEDRTLSVKVLFHECKLHSPILLELLFETLELVRGERCSRSLLVGLFLAFRSFGSGSCNR